MQMLKLTTILSVAAAWPLAAAADIGAVGAVNRQMTGQPPVLDEPALLLLGDTIVQDELIETTDTGSGQLLFLDQTTLSIGPLTTIVIDEYVYNPNQQTGEVAVNVAKGALRFIGGKITKSNEATIGTPTASIGIRGGMAVATVEEDGTTEVINLASSSITITRNCDNDGDGYDDGDAACEGEPSSSVVLSRPGAKATAGPNGVTFTGLATSADMAGIYGALEGTGDGGITEPPTTVRIVDGSRQVAPVNSQVIGSPYSNPVSTTGENLAGAGFEPTNDDPNSESQDFNTISEILEDEPELIPGLDDPMRMQPDPSIIANLTGTATYSGPAMGTQSFVSAPSQDIAGSFDLTYNFGNRDGLLTLNLLGGPLPLAVDAVPGTADYQGSDALFGGNSTISAEGGFFIEGSDPRGYTEGDFAIDLPTTDIEGTYGGPRTD